MNSQPTKPSTTHRFSSRTRPRKWGPLGAVALPALLVLALDPRPATAGPPDEAKPSKTKKSRSKPDEAKLSVRKSINQIDGLTVEELADGTTILRLLGHVEPTFNVYRLSDPDRLVVDVAQSERGKAVPHVPVDSWAVGRVTISSVDEHDTKLARVVVNLKRESSYIVVPKGRDLAITITPKEVAPEAYFARKSAGQRQAEIESMKSEARKQASELEAAARAKAQNSEARARSSEAKASSAEERARAAESRADEAAERARAAEREAARVRAEAEAIRKRAEAEAARREREAADEAARLEANAEAKISEREAEAAKRERAAAKREREAADEAARLEANARVKISEREAAAARRAQAALEQAARLEAEAKAEAAKREAEAARRAQAALEQAARLEAEAKAEAARREREVAKREREVLEQAARLEAMAAKRAAELEEAAKARAKKLEASAEAKAAQLEASAEARAKKLEAAAKAKAAQHAREVEAQVARKARAAEAEVARLEAEALARVEAREREAAAEAKKLEAVAATKAAQREREALAAAARLEAAAETKAAQREREALAAATRLEAEAKSKAAQRARAAEAEAAKLEAAARARASKLEREADAKLARAEAAARAKANEATRLAAEVSDAANKREQAAAARAAKLEAEAAAKVARAEAEAARKAREAAKLEAEAAKSADGRKQAAAAEAAKLEAEAANMLAEAERLAKARQSALASAEEAAAEAERRAKHAELRAAEAAAEAEAAEIYAKRVRESAEAKAKQAEALLAQAESAMKQAEQDSEQAQQSHDEAKQALADARKAARKLGKRDKSERAELERAVAQAEAAAATAKQREQQAEARLAKLERDHEQLAEALATKQAEADALRGELADKRGALARAKDEAREARSRYEALGGDEGPQKGDKRAHRKAKTELAKAETDLVKLRKQAAAEQSKLEEIQAQVASAREQLGETLAANQERRSLTQQWEAEREAAGQATVRDVRFEDGPNDVRVVVELDGPVIYDASSLTPNMTMLELRDARIPAGLERSLDTTSFHGPIDRITSFREGNDVKIVVASALGDPAGIELDRRSNRLIWKFPKLANDELLVAPPSHTGGSGSGYESAPPQLASDTSPEPAAGHLLAQAPERTEVVSLGGNKVSGFSTPPVMAARPGTKLGGRSRWRGERIDIELQDAPIKDVLLLFSDIGRVNIIAGPEVQGSVTMKLSAVPWDQALDIILRSLQLGMVQEGNVIRVATQASLEEERRKAIEEANAQVQLKPLETRLIPLSYANVQEMLPKVQSVLSSRGSVTPDSRTNMLIVMDVAENIALAESLVRQLDTQTPQVLIEARIVEARTNWLRQLGIQWGFDFISSPGTGNPTGLLFPNSIGVAGGSGSNQSPVRGLILPGAAANPNYAVDLPAPVSTGNGGAIGFSFGSLSGNLNTNLRLSAAEDEGEVRIISAPKIVTLDNTQAQIEQGVQIPISQVSAQGVNTRYVNATLGLRVTPHVTNEGAVMLEVQVQKNEADFVNTGARGDPTILTKSAQSQLLIVDGDTAVIGGIYTRNQAINHNKVPWFADIPIIGWFFKNRTERDDRSEMLIFLTPRIVNRSTSIGG